MKKLNLKIDELRIDSFVTDAESAERGTVQGAQITAAGTCGLSVCRCTRADCYQPSEPGYATIVNNVCIRC
jgi:hypothetical protein